MVLPRRTPSVTMVTKKLRLGVKGEPAKVQYVVKGNDERPGPHHLPLDTLYEIAIHLKPIDILYLARTCKAMHRKLMSKSSAFVWKATFSQIRTEMPDIPEDMSIPAMVNLAFDPRCHACDVDLPLREGEDIRVLDFELGVRFCKSCADLEIIHLYPKSPMYQTLVNCLPTTKDYYRNYLLVTTCLLSEYQEFLKKCERMAKDELETYSAERKMMVEKYRSCMDYWFDWNMEYSDEIRDDLIETRSERYNHIKQKLRDIGYDEEVSYIDKIWFNIRSYPWTPTLETSLLHHPLVDKFERLTEEEWDEISKPLRKYMNKVQKHMWAAQDFTEETKRRTIAVKVYRKELAKLPLGSLAPTLVDLYEWKPIHNLTDVMVTKKVENSEIEETIKTGLEAWLAEFRKDAMHLLTSFLFDPRSPSTPSIEDRQQALELATTTVRCGSIIHSFLSDREDPNYDIPMFYPEFLHHQCNHYGLQSEDSRTISKWDEALLAEDENLQIDRLPGCRLHSWSPRALSLDVQAQAVVGKIVEDCGLDPKEATVVQMDVLDLRLVCLKCSFGHKPDGERIYVPYTWRMAVRHCMQKHMGSPMVNWSMLPAADAAKARELEDHEIAVGGSRPHREWCCVRCFYTSSEPGPLSMSKIRQHCQKIHVIDEQNCQEGPDYYRTLEAPPCAPLPVRLVPSAVRE